jgi:hypothetical protein
MSAFLDLMTQSYVDLLKTFFTAVDALNNKDIATIGKLVHENIVLNPIHFRLDEGTVRGRTKVVNFLEAKIKKHGPQMMPISPISVDSRKGIVSGLAIWDDPNDGAAKELINYSFMFSMAADGKWLIHNMYASAH